MAEPVRNLVLAFGDQLDHDSPAFNGFDSRHDAVLMMEVAEEATYVAQHKIRLVLFFSAMRHFRDELREKGRRVFYREIDDPLNGGSFTSEVEHWATHCQPARLVVLTPGDYRVQKLLQRTARKLEIPLEIREDRSFFSTQEEFDDLTQRSTKLILENFYRAMRRKHQILLDHAHPKGGKWNFDAENRKPLTDEARQEMQPFAGPKPDKITHEVIGVVEKHFASSPGTLQHFDYPVNRSHARGALRSFIQHRLAAFGSYQDAMAADEPYLFHSRLSSSLNLHLLSPREVVQAAVAAYEEGRASLNSVEGFVRQILGWREFVRGVYWKHMPGYATKNALGADLPVPRYLWSGETEMNCVRHAVGAIKEHAYAHHIHRLMVLGLHCLLLGVHPYRFHEWHLSMFVDAIDWVSLPNALGMSQFGDGGIMGTKPYCASGNYINRMSDYCGKCRYDPSKATGENACPFTTLYWDFLARNREHFEHNGRMRYQLLNLNRIGASKLIQIRREADRLRSN